jgi:hypothetical protein
MARPASPVGFVRPEIPTLVPEPPSGDGWIHEIKHDGYRTLMVIDQGKVKAFSRHGRDWTGPYRRVVEAAGKLSCQTALIDGEIIVQDENGISDFDALRSAIYTAPQRLVFFAFDLLYLNGQDLQGHPLMERRALLRKLIESDPRSPIQFSDHADCDGALFFKHAAELGLEGIVSKRARSLYAVVPPRTVSRPRTWWRASSSFSVLRSTTVASHGHCSLGSRMGTWSLRAGDIAAAVKCQSRMGGEVGGIIDRKANSSTRYRSHQWIGGRMGAVEPTVTMRSR